MSATAPISVLVVEDEALVAISIEEILLGAGFHVCGLADRPAAAIALARAHRPALAVIDVRLAAGGDGVALAHDLAAFLPIGILFATGNPAEVARRARAGQGCLAKPFEGRWLVTALNAIQVGPPAQVIPGFQPLPFARLR